MERKGMDGSGTSGGEETLPVIENREDSQVLETSQFSMNSDRNQSWESANSTVGNDLLSKLKMRFDEINTGPVHLATGNSTTPSSKDQFRPSVESQGQELLSPDTMIIPAASVSSEINLVTNCHDVSLETKLPDAIEPNEAQLNDEVGNINENKSFQVIELLEDPNNPYITHWDSDNDERCTPPIIEHPIRRISENRGENHDVSRDIHRNSENRGHNHDDSRDIHRNSENRGHNRDVSRDAPRRDKYQGWSPHADSSRVASHRGSGIASSSTSGRSHRSNSGQRSVNSKTDQLSSQDFEREQTKKRKHSDCHLAKGKSDYKIPRVHPPNSVVTNVYSRILDYLSYLLEFPVEMISATKNNLGAATVQELASAMSTLIVETPEHEYLSDRPLIRRFQKVLAVVKTLPVERVVGFLEFFNTRVFPSEKLRKIENEQLLLNIGLLMGSITLHFRQPDLGLDMLFNFLLCSPRCAHSFAHGLLSTNIFLIGYKNLCPFWDLCRKRQSVLIAIFKNPRFSDVRFAQPVIEMIQQRLNFKAPDITFDQFFDKFSEHVFTLKRDDNELSNCARILAMLVAQNGTDYFEGSFTIQLDDWIKKWKSGTISNEGFTCFIESFGIIAEALRGSDVPPATQKQQDVLMAIGNMTNVPPMITKCVNKSVWKLLGAVGVPNQPFEKLEHEKPKMPARPGPTAAHGSSKKKLGSGSDKNQDKRLSRKHKNRKDSSKRD